MTQKKRILVGTGGLALIAVITGLVWWFLPPSTKDFASAQATAEKITEYKGTTLLREYIGAVSALSKEGKSYEQIAGATSDEKAKLIDALDRRSENAAKLESSRVMRDKDVKAAYATYDAQEKKYAAYLRSYADAYPAFSSSFRTCNEVFQITRHTQDIKAYASLHRKASEDCLKDLNVLSKSSSKPLADYAVEFIRIVNARQKTFDGITAGTTSESAASAAIKQLGADLTKNDPSDELTALSKEALFNGQLDVLIDVLEKKAEQTN